MSNRSAPHAVVVAGIHVHDKRHRNALLFTPIFPAQEQRDLGYFGSQFVLAAVIFVPSATRSRPSGVMRGRVLLFFLAWWLTAPGNQPESRIEAPSPALSLVN